MSRLRFRPRLVGVALAAGLAVLPSTLFAQPDFCNVRSVVVLLSDVAHRVAAAPMSRPTLSEAKLLADTISLARGRADRRLRAATILDTLASDERLQSRRSSTPLLSATEFRDLERWNAICGSQLVPSEHEVLPAGTLDAHWTAPGRFHTEPDGGQGSSSRSDRARGAGFPWMPERMEGHRYPTEATAIPFVLVVVLALVALAMQAADGDARRSRRYSCNAPSSLRVGEQKGPAIIVDISRTGCKIRVAGPLANRAKCSLWLDNRWIDARVVWSNKHYAGVDFPKVLSHASVQSLVRGSVSGPVGELSAA